MSAFGGKADISRTLRIFAAPGADCKIRLLALIITGCFNKQGQRGQGTSGRVQRWCDCDYHHDYGAGAKGAARLGLDGANGGDSKFRKLCSQLYIFGNLLEQSSPPFVHHYASGRPYCANSFLLFWLSLIPAATAWMGENFLVPIPTAFYGGILLMPAIAYYLLQKAILRKQGSESLLANALGADIKGKISPVL